MDIEQYLIRAINIKDLLKTNPELFNFKRLGVPDLIQLLRHDPAAYLDLVSPFIVTASDKFSVLLSLGAAVKYKKVRDKFTLTDDDLDRLTDIQYYNLLKADFKKYIRKERFENFNKTCQSEFILKRPEWFFTTYAVLPKFTANNLSELAQSYPSFIDTHVSSFTGLTTYAGFWESMIKYNLKYEDIFLANTKSLITKTDVRQVMRKFPKLVKKLDGDVIANSKLSVKDWVLLTDSVIKDNKKIFTNWSFKDDVKEAFRLDLVVEMLSGKSKISTRSQNAIDKVIKIEKEEEEDAVDIVDAAGLQA